MIGSVFAFWYGLKAVLKNEYPLLAVASGSMEPTLNVGDLIVVQGGLEAPYNEIDVGYTNGTIIVFQGDPIGKAGELIVHRAVKKEYNDGVWYFTTHGDNNPKGSHERFSQEYLVGKVVGYIPLIGHIPLFVREPYGMIIILLLMLILIFAEFLPIWKRKPQPSENASISENVP
jgi:signal peptidase I